MVIWLSALETDQLKPVLFKSFNLGCFFDSPTFLIWRLGGMHFGQMSCAPFFTLGQSSSILLVTLHRLSASLSSCLRRRREGHSLRNNDIAWQRDWFLVYSWKIRTCMNSLWSLTPECTALRWLDGEFYFFPAFSRSVTPACELKNMDESQAALPNLTKAEEIWPDA